MKFNLTYLRRHATIQNGAIALALLIAMSWVLNTVITLKNNFKYQQDIDTANQEIQLLQLQNQNLKFQQAYLKSDEFLELSARDKLNKAAPGEHLVFLPSSQAVKDTTTATAVSKTAQTSNFAQWMQFFFGQKQT